MSSPDDPAARKAAALDHLRFTKKSNNSSAHPASSFSLSTVTTGMSYPPQPAQSRDATVPSRYFTPQGHRVLVPSSSPLSPSPQQQQPYTPYSQYRPHVAPVAVAHRPFQSQTSDVDLFTAASNFTFHGANLNAPIRRPRDVSTEGHVAGAREEGPPRKRPNLGTPTIDLTDSPVSSPQIRRPGAKRRVASDMDSDSDEDFLPESILGGPSKPRITRGRPPVDTPVSPPQAPVSVDSDPNYVRFKLTMPMENPRHIEAAWVQSNKDVKRATALLSDATWAPPPLPAPTPAPPRPETVGRVKEVDEASKAQRMATKEMGKKSAIYANRTTLDTHQFRHYTSPVAVERSVASPAPRILPPRRRITRKLVVDSDSEPDYTDSDDDQPQNRNRPDNIDGIRALTYFNTSSSEALQELTGCTPEQAAAIIELREFESIEDLETKLKQGKKKAGPAGISPKMFDDCTKIFAGYGSVDSILEDCEQIGSSLRASIASWTSESAKEIEGQLADQVEDGALSLRHLDPPPNKRPNDYLVAQPELLSDTVQLKEYQLLGVNWLNLLYRSNLSCILADEMGLGKTIQVISFFAHLKAQGNKGPHLVVVPSSTLENWCREFARFAPSIAVQTYYAGKDERAELRQTLLDTQRCKSETDGGWEVLITTYNLAQGDDRDRKFFRRVEWDSCVFDEGHVLKNFQSQRYQTLLKFGSRWRLLLTGTPLQNNLQELVSLMNFILPEQFSDSMASLRAIFKVKGDSKVSLLSQERVGRAKKMMTPFVLRRRKDQVLKDLPKKTERIEWCEMTALQKTIYTDTLQRSRKFVLEIEAGDSREGTETPSVTAGKAAAKKKARPAATAKAKKTYTENSSNVLMDLRKGALHPMLFRTLFTDEILTGVTKQLLKEPDFKKRGALFDLVKEDMTVMTDAELQFFCATYKSTQKYLQDNDCYLDAGKVQTLLRLLADYREQGRKVLIFSQFTQILDILQAILKQREIEYLLLTGSTPVDVRQSLVDEFSEQESIRVFLLSTKAGGMGINLTAASVVIMFDQDFNPHNDRQAQDRAYRIGQKRDVDVIKLISRGTIEEDMLKLGETKLALDEAVAGDTEEKGDVESAPEREMKTSLLEVLRQQFKLQEGEDEPVQVEMEVEVAPT
ncbi:SNF2 family N-terminal domain-containing protein [Mycena maculata]|uniref:DNA helicase n=1 Tax=Mycena maculata TaxID=230809 RepID=A0AAD7NQ03_9AGAR|nr:SNF2 family N-terminal domain-containing protein [Mycena maculata]